MPLLGLIETPRRLPNSITEAVLEKNKGGCGHPAAPPRRRTRKAERLTRRSRKDSFHAMTDSRSRAARPAAGSSAARSAAGAALAPQRRGATTRPSRRISRSRSRRKMTGRSPVRSAHYDKAQLQRGLKVYKEVCSACHSMNLVPFRTLEDLGYSRSAGEGLRRRVHDPGRPERRRRDVRPARHAVRLLPVAVPERGGGGRRQQRRGSAGHVAARQGARRRARLPAVRLRHLHAVSGRRPGLYPLAADRL